MTSLHSARLRRSAGANRLDANAHESLIGMLDRSPEPAYWGDFFEPRWTLRSAPELDAVAAWLEWFEASEPDSFHANTYDRARETLQLLKQRRGSLAARGLPDGPGARFSSLVMSTVDPYTLSSPEIIEHGFAPRRFARSEMRDERRDDSRANDAT